MHELARILLLTCIGIFLVSLAFMAVARPRPPARAAPYGFVLPTLGPRVYWWAPPGGLWGLAGLALMFGGLCDIMDGELARRQGAVRPSGAFLDSSLDRLSEIVLFGGLAAGAPDRAGAWWACGAAAA